MDVLGNYQWKRAIKSYIKILPPLLTKRYGKIKNYTEGQVKKTVEAAGLNEIYIDYCYVIFMDRLELNEMIKEKELSLDYNKMRQEIADYYFDGNADFTIQDTPDVPWEQTSKQYDWRW